VDHEGWVHAKGLVVLKFSWVWIVESQRFECRNKIGNAQAYVFLLPDLKTWCANLTSPKIIQKVVRFHPSVLEAMYDTENVLEALGVTFE
jgi:hypothetical protein